jgi:hypothetical protein
MKTLFGQPYTKRPRKHRGNRKLYPGKAKSRARRVPYGHKTEESRGWLTKQERRYVTKQRQKGRLRRGR